MKRAKVTPPTVSVALQGSVSALPAEIPLTTGLLVHRQSDHITAYWNQAGWVPLNSAGYHSKFHCDPPNIPVGHWAIINGPRLDLIAGHLYDNHTAVGLMMAMHFVHVENFQPGVGKIGELADQTAEDHEFSEVREDVDDYVAQCKTAAGVTELE